MEISTEPYKQSEADELTVFILGIKDRIRSLDELEPGNPEVEKLRGQVNELEARVLKLLKDGQAHILDI